MFKYWGYGLHIASQIEFPELLPAVFDKPDVTIQIGKTPDRLEGDDVFKRAFSYVSKDQYLLTIKSIGKYYVSHGNMIIAEPAPGSDEKSIRLFLLGPVLAVILYQHNFIPLHASAILKDGKLDIFAGNSGAGKSTLIAFMATIGYQVFTDDICVMEHDPTGEKNILCNASYPMIKLWEDAIKQLDSGLFTTDYKLRQELPKYGHFFYDSFSCRQFPPGKVFILNNKGRSNNVAIKQLGVVQAFKQLELHAYKNQLIVHQDLREFHFSLLSELVNSVPVYEVTRPQSGTTLEQFYDAINSFL